MTTDHELISLDESGLRLHFRQSAGVPLPLSPPAVVSPLEGALGQSFVTTPAFLNPATGSRMRWRFDTASASESVPTSAGVFPDCIRVHLAVHDAATGAQLADVDHWLARGHGLVRRRGQYFGARFDEVLTSLDRR